MAFKMNGFSGFKETHDGEPDWSKMNISATGDNKALLTEDQIGKEKLTDEQKETKEKYPELYEARYGDGKNTIKTRLQAVEQGMDMGGDFIPVGAAMGLGSKVLQGDVSAEDLKKLGISYVTKKADKFKKGASSIIQGAQNIYGKLNK